MFHHNFPVFTLYTGYVKMPDDIINNLTGDFYMKKFLLYPKSGTEKAAVFWNLMASGLNSVVSIILLLFVTRIAGTEDAGIFSLGFSTAQMMLCIGNYGMRNFQSTDIKDKYAFGTYLGSRILTSTAMMIISILFVIVKGYYPEKALIVVFLCLLKVTDAVDDLYGGFFQRNGRLDISGKILFLRVFAYCTAFLVTLLVSGSVMAAILASILVSALVLILLLFLTKGAFSFSVRSFSLASIGRLLVECFPLCLGAFLLIYLGNAPKYAIDSYLSSTMQAYYTYLFMPCFVINLLVGFVLQPVLVKLTVLWEQKKNQAFLKYCFLMHLAALGISLVILLCGAFLGCPVLSIVFGVNLNSYSAVLDVLLIGGGFFALAVIDQVILTIMRHQYAMLWGFGLASLFATVLSPVLVKSMGLMGTALAYTCSDAILFLIFLLFILFYYRKERCS